MQAVAAKEVDLKEIEAYFNERVMTFNAVQSQGPALLGQAAFAFQLESLQNQVDEAQKYLFMTMAEINFYWDDAASIAIFMYQCESGGLVPAETVGTYDCIPVPLHRYGLPEDVPPFVPHQAD